MGCEGAELISESRRYSGYLPISIKYEDRRAYYEAFTAYRADDNLIPMLEIFVEREFARLSEYLNIIK